MIFILPKSVYGAHEQVRDFMTGAAKEACRPTRAYFFVDVRDVASSLVLAAEKNEAAGKRFLIAADKFYNNQIAEIIGEKFPQLRDRFTNRRDTQAWRFPWKASWMLSRAGRVQGATIVLVCQF